MQDYFNHKLQQQQASEVKTEAPLHSRVLELLNQDPEQQLIAQFKALPPPTPQTHKGLKVCKVCARVLSAAGFKRHLQSQKHGVRKQKALTAKKVLLV